MNYENLKKLLNELTDIVYKERITVAFFLGISVIIKCAFYYLNQYNTNNIQNLTVVEWSKDDIQKENEIPKEIQSTHLVPFDPNIVSYEELIQLGFTPKNANTLLNYRNSGAKFYKKEDLKRVWGISPNFYSQLEPYIVISNNMSSSSSKKNNGNTPTIIDINIANLEQWKSLPGIGDYFANKFISMRIKLGAFVSIEQIGETYGLADSTFIKIKPFLKITQGSIRKINVNEASAEEIRQHPYILKWQADDILKHRPIYGFDDLFELYTFKDKTKNKWVESYFEF